MKWYIFALGMYCKLQVLAQNLIPNADFEQNIQGKVLEWQQPLDDYYHYEQHATKEGYNAINGLCLLQPEPSEYLVAKLKEPLVPGATYCIQLQTFKGPTYIGSFNRLGAIDIAFTDTPPLVWRRRKLFLQPLISLPITNAQGVFTQPEPAQFVAQGNEQYIVIGKFHQQDVTLLTLQQKKESLWREQYYECDSIKKYYKSCMPPPPLETNKRKLKRALKHNADSTEELQMAMVADLKATAAKYAAIVEQLTSHELDSGFFHVRIYFDNICVTPKQADGLCNCTDSLVATKPFVAGQSYQLRNIQFDTDKATFKPGSYVEMDTLLYYLVTYPSMHISIEGHTDSVNTEEYNIDLSERRAKAVYTYLIEHGVEPNRLTYKGYGESRPVTSNNTTEGRAQNRRVEFTVTKFD
ncbi:MAG: OmpA family protein [Bacteroidia bacterium]|jgi:outer membrane protein OmpA-like peptidoglycan-associated protein|nr:OmpA family protein [Bacteroidia bacterium]